MIKIITVLFTIIITAFTLNLFAQTESIPAINSFSPLYTQPIFITDYRINQPVREICRWNSIMAGLYINYHSYNKGKGKESDLAIIGTVGIWSGISMGVLIGITKGFIYNSKEDPINFKSARIQHEQSITPRGNGSEVSDQLILKVPVWIWDDLGVKYSYSELDLKNKDNERMFFSENKLMLTLRDYYDLNRGISLFYELGFGYSINDYDQNGLGCSSIAAGIKLNVLDLGYFKFSGSFEYSPIMQEMKKYSDDAYSNSVPGIEFSVGTTIF